MNWKEELLTYKKSEIVINPYSEEECELSPDALGVYDFIKGSEFLINNGCNTPEYINNFNEALNYFRENWPKEYYILLD